MQKLLDLISAKLNLLISILGGRNIALLAVSIIVTIFSLFFNENWIQNAYQKTHEIAQLNRILQEVQLLQSNVYKAESSQRGFLITNAKEYLLPYDISVDDAKKSLQFINNALLNLTPAEAYKNEQTILSKLSSDVGAKISEMNVTLEFATNGKLADANKIVKLDSAMTQMHAINHQIDRLKAALNQRLQMQYKARKFIRGVIHTSVIAGPIILIMLVVLVIKQLLKELSDKAHLQQRLYEENQQYERRTLEQSQLLRSLALDYQGHVEHERHKLARELHDELGSILTTSKMDISWTIKTLAKTHPEIAAKLKKTNSYLDQGINFKRQVVQELHPSMISTFGFWPALRSLIEDAAERNHWELSLTLPDENTVIHETISLVAYRVVQETLTNCNKYAKATAVSIHMINDDKYLKIEIQDNGVGVDLEKLDATTHGLSGMRHRVLAIGGRFEILSGEGKGLFTRVILPLDIKSSDSRNTAL